MPNALITPPEGYAVRSAAPDDLPAVAALMAAVDQADYGETVFGEDVLHEDWTRPRLDLSSDTAILQDRDGDVVGYVLAFDEEVPDVIEAIGMVHPEHRGRGLGTTLVQAQEERARRQAELLGATVRLRTAVAWPDPPAHNLLAGRGYDLVRSFFHMEISLAGAPVPSPPEGIEFRTFRSGADERALHGVIQDAFRGQWQELQEPFDQWLEARQASGFDPGLCFLAFAGEEVVGAVTGREMEAHGWVNELAVLPAWRGRGIGSYLLQLAFAALGDRGFDRVLLNVDATNEAGAVGIYERAGMHVHRRWDLFEREIRAAPSEIGR